MSASRWVALGASSAALAVGLGAFGAHGLHERLVATGHLDTWETAVRYQMWHALALFFFVMLRARRPLPGFVGLAFALGTLFFSGSLYGLSLGLAPAVLGPITPFGGVLLIAGWGTLAVAYLREPGPGAPTPGA